MPPRLRGHVFGKLVIEAAEQIATAVGEEVLKRLLGAFRGTADRMDQVGRNLTENEDSHVQQINGILAGMNSPSAKGPLKLAGGVSSLTSGLTHHAGPASDDAPHLDQAGGGSVGPFGLPVGHSAKSIGSSGLRVPEQAGAVPERAAATSQQPRPGSAGPRAVAPHHTGDPVSADGHRATQPGGLGRPSAAQPSGVSGVSGSAPYGQAGGATGQGAPGQVRDAASAQQRNTLRPREEERAMDPVELLADRPYEDAASEG